MLDFKYNTKSVARVYLNCLQNVNIPCENRHDWNTQYETEKFDSVANDAIYRKYDSEKALETTSQFLI